MSRRLLVDFLIVSALAALTACGGGSLDSSVQPMDAAPVELEVTSPENSGATAAYDELLDPEFGCNGGGSLEYGLVDRPDLD